MKGERFIEKVPMIYLQQFLDDFHMWLFFQAQLAQKTTLVNDSKLKEQEFKEQVRVLFEQVKSILLFDTLFAVLKICSFQVMMSHISTQVLGK